jgi:hypothetical protein
MKHNLIENVYKYRGFPVTVLGTETVDDEEVIVGIWHQPVKSEIRRWKSLDELYRIPKLEELTIDDKILVKASASATTWAKRHFAGISPNGKALCFSHGCTSWSKEDDGETIEWEEWKLPLNQVINNVVDSIEEWQPIDTAPRDGTVILVAFEDKLVWESWHTGNVFVHNRIGDIAYCDPTHWRQLPKPPKFLQTDD